MHDKKYKQNSILLRLNKEKGGLYTYSKVKQLIVWWGQS